MMPTPPRPEEEPLKMHVENQTCCLTNEKALDISAGSQRQVRLLAWFRHGEILTSSRLLHVSKHQGAPCQRPGLVMCSNTELSEAHTPLRVTACWDVV
jgi:hypothetical protein